MCMNPWVYQLSTDNTTNDPAAFDLPSTLTVTDVNGDSLMLIQMPPCRSLCIGAIVTDIHGASIAWLRSAHTQHQYGSSSSSYLIYGNKPRYEGQNRSGNGFLWATVTRAPFSNVRSVTNANQKQIFTGWKCMMFDMDAMQTYLLDASGQGVLHVSKLHQNRCFTIFGLQMVLTLHSRFAL